MTYLPDTNVFSAYLSGRSKPLTERMASAFAAGELRLSVMVLAELEFGAEKARQKLGETKFVRRVEQLRKHIDLEPIGSSFPQCYAKVRTALEADGKKIGDRDTIIAAHALSIGATMVTANIGEFSRVPGLRVENWERGQITTVSRTPFNSSRLTITAGRVFLSSRPRVGSRSTQ